MPKRTFQMMGGPQDNQTVLIKFEIYPPEKYMYVEPKYLPLGVTTSDFTIRTEVIHEYILKH